MKKVLLGTTALLAASMMSGTALGQARTAMTANNFNLTLGGFTTFRFEYQSKSPGQNVTTLDADGTLANEPRNHNLDFDAELAFGGNATIANGTKLGWVIELEAGGTELANIDRGGDPNIGDNDAGGDYIDDNYLYIDGRLGKLTLGGVTEPINPPSGGAIGIKRTYSSAGGIALTDEDGNALAVAGNNRASFTNTLTVNGGRNRVIYQPPAIAGINMMIAYAPDLTMENTTAAEEEDDVINGTPQAAQDLHLMGYWSGAVAGAPTRLTASWATSKSEDKDPTANTLSNPNDRWKVAGDVQFGDLAVGAQYRTGIRNAVSRLQDETTKTYGIGATYKMGVWTYGAAWEKAVTEQKGDDAVAAVAASLYPTSATGLVTPSVTAAAATARGTGEDTATRWDFGVSYTGLGDGRTILVGIRQETWKDNNSDPDLESKVRSIDIQHNWQVVRGFDFNVGYTNYRYTHHAGLDATDTQDTRTAHGLKIETKFTF